jgi:hypothetical protein
MLRIGFLPSDFNPMLLMLGEQEDLRALGGVLRQFARDGKTVRLHELTFCAAGRTRLVLTGDAGPAGLHATANAAGADAAGAFVWRLDAPLAAEFAELVDGLATASRKAGSEMLECGIEEAAEIPVKVSRGEYTEAFLLC